MSFTDKVVGNVVVTIVTSVVKYSLVSSLVSSHCVTVLFIDEVPYHLQVIVAGSIV